MADHDSVPLSPMEPTPAGQRILSLDALRGFAVLGILVMNIQGFSMISAAYFNPMAYGDMEGLNRWVWIVGHLLTDLKFMTLFSFLFGAGIVLMASRAKAKGLSPLRFHLRRTAGLLLFGLIHAYLFWYGDILVWYSFCGLIVFFFRRRSPRTLVILGLISFAVPSLLYVFFAASLPHMPPEVYQQLSQDFAPGSEKVAEEVGIYQSGWLTQMEHRVPLALALHTFVFAVWAGWRICGVMLIGMALFKWGVLSAERSRRFYQALAVFGLAAGWPLIAYGVVRNFADGWTFDYSRFVGTQFNYWGSLAVSLGYVGILMLLCQAKWAQRIMARLAAVGRLAFTNYLAQTLICTTIFYGHGLGLFGTVERTGQIGVVLAVWVFQILFSTWWLKRFRMGPVESAWRSLTYLRLQPLKEGG